MKRLIKHVQSKSQLVKFVVKVRMLLSAHTIFNYLLGVVMELSVSLRLFPLSDPCFDFLLYLGPFLGVVTAWHRARVTT